MSDFTWKHYPDSHTKQVTRDAQQWQASGQQNDGDAEHDRDEPQNGRKDPEQSASDTAQNSRHYPLTPATRSIRPDRRRAPVGPSELGLVVGPTPTLSSPSS